MIISFARANHCARCRRNTRTERKAFLHINLRSSHLAWLTFRFRLCNACADELQTGMQDRGLGPL